MCVQIMYTLFLTHTSTEHKCDLHKKNNYCMNNHMSKPTTEIHTFSLLKESAKATTQLFVADPKPVEEKNLGRLFAIVEIESTQKVNKEIIDLMIRDIHDYYYRTESLEIEAAFENALQKTNRRLQEMIGEVGEEWLYHFTALFGVQKKNEVVFAHVGKSIAFMTYNNSVVDIVDTAKSKAQDISPVKIFSNIVTGTLSQGSFLFFSTETILDYLSKEKIRRTLVEYPNEKSIEVFTQLLEHNTNDVNFASLILQYQEHAQTAEPLSITQKQSGGIEKKEYVHEESLDSMDDLKNQQKETEELLSSSLWPSIKKRLKEKKEEARKKNENQEPSKAQEYTDEILSGPSSVSSQQTPQWKQHLEKGVTISTQLTKDVASTVQKKSVAVYKKLRSKPLGVKSISQKTPLATSDKKEEQEEATTAARRVTLQTRGMEKTVGRFVAPIVRWVQSLTIIQKIFFSLAILVLVVFGQSVIKQDDTQNTEVQENQYATTIAEIDLKVNKAKAAILYNEEEATQLLSEAQDLLNQIPKDSATYAERGEELSKVIQDQMNSINNIAPLDALSPVVDFTKINDAIEIKKIVLLGGSIYGFDNSNGSIYRGDTATGETSVIKEDRDSGAIVSAAKLSPGTALLSKSNGVLEILNPSENSVTQIDLPADGVTKNPVDVTVFGDRIYTLDPTNNQIYRYDAVTDGYSGASPWIADDLTIESGASLAIDADVYVLKQDGGVIKMSGGLQEDFSLEAVEPALSSGKEIYTDENSNLLYILDPAEKRIVVFNKKGELINQYTSPSFTDVKDMAIDEEEGKMYILSGAQIYAVDISDIKQDETEE